MFHQIPDEIVQQLPAQLERAIEFTLKGFKRLFCSNEESTIEIECGTDRGFDEISCRFEPSALPIVFSVCFRPYETPNIYEFDMIIVESKNDKAECFLCNVNEYCDWESDGAISDGNRYEIEFLANFVRGQFQNVLLESDEASKPTVRFSVLL